MSLIKSIARHALKELTAGTPYPGGAQAWGSYYSRPMLPGERSYRHVAGDPMMSNIVAACVLWIARNYPKAPIMLTDLRTEKRVESHPFLDLQHYPNPRYSGVTMDWALMMSFVTDGNAYKVKRRTEGGRHAESWYVPHWMLEPRWPKDGSEYLTDYAYQPGDGRVYSIKAEDVVHRRYGLDPRNTRKGLSPLKSLLREIYTDEEAARFSAALLHNMGLPGMIVAPREAVKPEDADAVKAKLEQEFGGDKRGGFLVPYGPTDVTVVGFDPKQMDLSALRDIPEERVSAVIGIPAGVVGLGTGMQQTKVGATMRELREIAWQDGIMPLHTIMAPEISRDELSEFVDDVRRYEVGFDYDKVPELSENLEERAGRVLDGVRAGAATVADWRQVSGLEVRAHDAVFLRPFAALEVQDGATGRVGALNVVDGTSRATPAQAELNALQRADVKLIATKAATPADARYLRTLDRISRQAATAMADDLSGRFDDLGTMARNAFIATGAKATELQPDDEALVVRIIRAMGITEWAERELAPIFRRYTGLVAEATYGAVAQRVGIDISWAIDDPVAVALIESGGKRAGLVDIPEDTRKALYRAIAEAREAGENPIQIARRIRDEVPSGPFPGAGAKYRAELIARTETLHAQRASTLAAGKSAGFDEYLVFDARLGETDEECELLDQTVVSLAEAESLMDSEHPNGSRSFSPIPRTSGTAARPEPVALKDAGGDFRCTGCKRLLAEAAGPGTRIKCRCGVVNEQLAVVVA